MLSKFVPCCSFPTSTIFVDDDDAYLRYLSLKFAGKIPFKVYNGPQKALDHFNKHYQHRPFIDEYVNMTEAENSEHRCIDIDLTKIIETVYSAKRFDQMTVVVSDYAMPEMNGLEFLQNIEHRYVKKILLTGEADAAIAVKAFNQGLIDKYIRKDDPNVAEMLSASIAEYQQTYFDELSSLAIDALTKNPDYPVACLSDPVFIQFFQSLCAKLKICEYYLIDAAGSFLLRDKQGVNHVLIMKDQGSINDLVEELEDQDEDVPGDILRAVKAKTHLLYLTSDQWSTREIWLDYLFPLQELRGRRTYYYTLISDPEKQDLANQKMLDYATYLANQDIDI